MRELIVPYIFLTIAGITGAVISKQINDGSLPVFCSILSSIFVGLIWGIIAKKSTNMSLSTVIFDIVLTTVWILTFVAMGDKLSFLQIFGFLVSLAGIVMMAA